MRLSPLIPFVLGQSDLSRLHHRALRILEEVGLRVTEPRLVRRLKTAPSFSERTSNIRFNYKVYDTNGARYKHISCFYT